VGRDGEPAGRRIHERNRPSNGKSFLSHGEGSRRSALLDWSNYDLADFDELNEILWPALKGDVPMPAPIKSGVLLR